MRHAYALMGVMVLVLFLGGLIAFNQKAEAPRSLDNAHLPMTLTSPSFNNNETIPLKFSCDGENISPELHIGNVPTGTKSLALVMDDPDIPESVKQARGIEKFDHWVLYNIPGDTTVIPEGASAGNVGINTKGEAKYTGPCPPDREHRYIFRLYALKEPLYFLKTPALYDVEEAAKGSMIEMTELIGRYERVK